MVSYNGRVPFLNPIGLADAGQTAWRLERAARRVPLDAPWSAPDSLALDSETAATWIDRTAYTALGKLFLKLFIQGLFSCDPENLSALHLLLYVHAGGGFASMTKTTGGAQQDRILGGSQAVSVELARRLGGRVHLSSPVYRLDWSDAGVVAHGEEGAVRARFAVVTLPLALVGRIDYRPALPVDRDQLHQRLPQGNVIKSMAVYESPWWRDEGLSGQSAMDVGPVCATYDNSPPGGTPGVLLCFVEGRHAIEIRRRPAEDRRAAVLDCLGRLFGPRALQTSDYLELDWSAEPWTRGCYGAHMPPGVWTQFGAALRTPVGPIHWAGSETAVRFPAYMDGAVESGERAAREILTRPSRPASETRSRANPGPICSRWT
jgi:monoamine oxidase